MEIAKNQREHAKFLSLVSFGVPSRTPVSLGGVRSSGERSEREIRARVARGVFASIWIIPEF